MTPSKFEKLKTIGRPDLEKWDDYLSLGFNIDDIDQLLEIVKQDYMMNSKDDSDDGYTSVHAWRILAQLNNNKIIEPFIAMLNQYSVTDSDWVTEEWPKVFGMLGKDAIQPLVEFMRLKSNEEYARITASDGLYQIYKHNENSREQIISAYAMYLKNADNHAYALNGLTICSIMEMKATELIEPVTQLFVNDIVDVSICGDLQDFEQAVGIRKSRSKPKPDYGKLMTKPHATNNTSNKKHKCEETYHFIDEYLDKYQTDTSLISTSHLDGFLAAIACSDILIMPSVWMVDIWGENAEEPDWESHDDFLLFSNCVFDYYKELKNELEQGDYAPLLEEDEKGKLFDTAWSNGFILSSDYWEKTSESFSTQAMINYGMIALLNNKDTKKTLKELHMDKDINPEQLQDNLSDAVYNIYQELQGINDEDGNDDLFFDVYNSDNSFNNQQTFIREGKKVGRNEPCPCGSGKKHKKCCLNK